MRIVHLCFAGEWKSAQESGYLRAASLQTEGFVHCSAPEQVAATAGRYFPNAPDLVALQIDTELLENQVKQEVAANGEVYPHVYGPINVSSVVDVVVWPPEIGGGI